MMYQNKPQKPFASQGNHPSTHVYDYGSIEDKAGVEYTNAMIITGIFIALHIQLKGWLWDDIWILITTGLATASWWYFRAYFKAVGDHETKNWITFIMGSVLLFGITNFLVLVLSGIDTLFDFHRTGGWEGIEWLIKTGVYSVLISLLCICLFSIKLLTINSKHSFPLKRIAVSTMICLPMYMLIELAFNLQAFWQILEFIALLFGGDTEQPEVGLFGSLFLLMPYLFLIQFFYRANKYDRT